MITDLDRMLVINIITCLFTVDNRFYTSTVKTAVALIDGLELTERELLRCDALDSRQWSEVPFELKKAMLVFILGIFGVSVEEANIDITVKQLNS